MRQHDESGEAVEKTVRDIKRKTRRHFGAEEKIPMVLQGLRGDESIVEICRREGLHQNLYYRWSKDFLEAGKKQLNGDTVREADSDEVKALRSEPGQLKEALSEALLENRLLKKHDCGWGGRYMRYTASEKLKIIRTVEQSSLGVKRTLAQIGILRATFSHWYGRDVEGGLDGLENRKSAPGSVWNNVSEAMAEPLVQLALAEPDMSPRE